MKENQLDGIELPEEDVNKFEEMLENVRKMQRYNMIYNVNLECCTKELNRTLSILTLFNRVPHWYMGFLHEKEVQFRQTLRHEGLEDVFPIPLSEVPWASLEKNMEEL